MDRLISRYTPGHLLLHLVLGLVFGLLLVLVLTLQVIFQTEAETFRVVVKEIKQITNQKQSYCDPSLDLAKTKQVIFQTEL